MSDYQPTREPDESEPKRRGRPPKNAPKSNAGRKPIKGKLKPWERRANMLRKSGTTPRDVLNHDWTYIKKSAEVERNCRFLWMSDIMYQKRLPLPGFVWEIWQPVDAKFLEETGIETPYARTRTAEGTPRCGDAFLMWAPKEMAEQCDQWEKEQSFANRMKSATAELEKQSKGMNNAGPTEQVLEITQSDGIEDANLVSQAEEERQTAGSALES